MKYLLSLLLITPLYLLSLLAQPASSESEPMGPELMPATEVNATSPTTPAPAASPIVLELFTSQGCSSCPPADELLAALADEPDVIALSFHVDYWNYLGWSDPFSSPYYSARQRDYTEALRARTYTPQLVVNGRQEMIGSRAAEVRAALATARKQTAEQAAIAVALSSDAPGKLSVNYTLEGPLADRKVVALLVQDEATSSINRGENRGRELHHVNVVRELKQAPAGAAGTFELTLPDGLDRAEAQVVLLVQHTKTYALHAAAHQSLSAR